MKGRKLNLPAAGGELAGRISLSREQSGSSSNVSYHSPASNVYFNSVIRKIENGRLGGRLLHTNSCSRLMNPKKIAELTKKWFGVLLASPVHTTSQGQHPDH